MSGYGQQHNFAEVPVERVRRSRLDRSFNHKTTFDAGNLIPVFVDEILPSDVVEIDYVSVCRMLSPLKQPMMDSLFLDYHFFFSPNRLVWKNWTKFLGAQDNPEDSVDFLIPIVDLTDDDWPGWLATGSQGDYMGLPAGNLALYPVTTKVSALPFRHTALIWNEWYRDENLQDSQAAPTDDGPDSPGVGMNGAPLPRNKRSDYFTRSLPFAQKGDAIDLPIGGSAPIFSAGAGHYIPVAGNGLATGLFDGSFASYLAFQNASVSITRSTSNVAAGTGVTPISGSANIAVGVTPDESKSNLHANLTGTYADLSTATAITINQLRQSIVMQQILEANARGGTRYIELLRMQFDVAPDDKTLQRPEYIGGSTIRLTASVVPQTSASGATPQGTLTAFMHGASTGRIVKSFNEHGYIFGFVSVRGDLTYQNQLHRMWARQTVWDFWRPEFSHLGEQSVFNYEMSFTNNDTVNNSVFGYQERGAEYRFKPNLVTSNFRSNSYISTNSLDVWHLAYDFGPVHVPLSDTFVQENPPISRVEAITGVPDQQFVFDGDFTYYHTRPMPVYSVPGLNRL